MTRPGDKNSVAASGPHGQVSPREEAGEAPTTGETSGQTELGVAEPNANLSGGAAKQQARRNRRNMRRQQSAYGALDLGTNNCRLLVARPSRHGFYVIDAFSRIIRLGEGVSSSHRLSEEAMSRTMDALKICAEKMRYRRVKRSRLIATQACRAAENCEDFIARVYEEVGLELEVVNNETEARLAVSGCASLIDRDCDWALVFDIGGGSSEFIWLDLRGVEPDMRRAQPELVDLQNCIAAWTSLSTGVVTLAEKHGGRDVSPALFEVMVEDVMKNLAPFEAKHGLRDVFAGSKVHLMGTSGTVTTIAGIHLQLPVYDRRQVDGCWLQRNEILNVLNTLIEMDYEGRVAQPCIGADRADLVLAGCAILEAVQRMWPCDRLRVADRGLREGILANLMAEDGFPQWRRPMREGGRRPPRRHRDRGARER